MTTSAAVDERNLQLVGGIGPKTEACLKAAGIVTLSDLAHAPVERIGEALDSLPRPPGPSVIRQQWIPQATKLSAGAAAPSHAARSQQRAAHPPRVRHNFTTELLLNGANGEVVGSKMVHVQTGEERTWGGWEPHEIIKLVEDVLALERSRATALAAPPARVAKGRVRMLCAFAVVEASHDLPFAAGDVRATLTVPTAGLKLKDPAVAVAEVYLRRQPPHKSIAVGDASADVAPGDVARLEVPGALRSSSGRSEVFAAVRIFSTGTTRRKPAVLNGVKLELVRA